MIPLPHTLLDQLHLAADSQVGLNVDDGRLVVKPTQPRYSLEELLAQCDITEQMTAAEREWLDSGTAGRDLL